MRLWECRYTMDTKWFTDKCASYLWSTTAPTIKSIRSYWNKIHPGGQKISDFETSMVQGLQHPASEHYHFRILERTIK